MNVGIVSYFKYEDYISSKIKKLKPTKEQIEKIYQIYKEDIENFNYKKV